MTILIFCIVVLLIGICLIKWGDKMSWLDECISLAFGATIVMLALTVTLIALPIWLYSHKNSEILYTQLLSERTTIESILDTEKDVNRALLHASVIKYNSTVIMEKTNSKRFILKDYYDQSLDWDGLQIIEWR